MDAVTVLTWLAAGEGEHTEFKEKYKSRRETPEAFEASPFLRSKMCPNIR